MAKSMKKAANFQKPLTREDFLKKKCFLPTKFWGFFYDEKTFDPKDILKKDGVEFIKRDDPYGRLWTVKLPDGWNLCEAEDNPAYIILTDRRGLNRARIYYKYNQFDAWIMLLKRYGFHQDMQADKDGILVMIATDSGREIYRTIEVKKAANEIINRELFNNLERMVFNWLQKKYPEWEKLEAYWDTA